MKDEDFVKERIIQKWLPDAILNIFVPATSTDSGKYKFTMDLHV